MIKKHKNLIKKSWIVIYLGSFGCNDTLFKQNGKVTKPFCLMVSKQKSIVSAKTEISDVCFFRANIQTGIPPIDTY